MEKNLRLVVGYWAEIAVSASLRMRMMRNGARKALIIICPTATECKSSASKLRISRRKYWKLLTKSLNNQNCEGRYANKKAGVPRKLANLATTREIEY